MSLVIKRLSHVSFVTNKLPEIINFYCHVFSAQIAHEFRNESNELYGVFLRLAPSTFVEFFNGQYAPESQTNYRHFCLEVEDLNQLAVHLKSKGLTPEPLRSRSDKTLQCWIADPDGNRIEFHQIDQESALFDK